MVLESIAILGGLALLVWSADKFVDGAAATAGHFRMPALLIGMLVIGFGTSAPEISVSVLAAGQGNSGLALGNAYGSNITNIALILGVSALLAPITVHSRVVRREIPVLLASTVLAWWLLSDGDFSSADAGVQLVLFSALVGWSVWEGLRESRDALGAELTGELPDLPLRAGLFWLVVGLVLLVVSSRLVVWGAVGLAQAFGISDLIIGLTIVAIGTSLPELASAVAAVRKGEHDLALGNVIGSNLFNTLLVAALAGAILPHTVDPALLERDFPVLMMLTTALFAMAYGWGQQRITRVGGGILVVAFAGYTAWLIAEVL
ncbi:MAG: calcium/sodium antiporter [Gammaproteobacteria bacterium]|nr:calcium/sodium antiporter [Gammaproteobacteria bacterium]